MSRNSQIFVNILLLYGRSLYAIVLGLVTARWTIKALGVSDYGIYCVVGGLMAFVGFLNSALASANCRFYAVKIQDTQECRKWFNTGFAIHTIFPLLLTIIGYPLGVALIKSFLTIPSDRIGECILVLRFSCLTWLVAMMNVPFTAMYEAKQRFAEITLYGCIASTCTAGFLYYMVTHPGVWLVRYAFGMCIASILPQILIAVRAYRIFPECKLKLGYLLDFSRMREIGAFAGWNLLAELSLLLRTNGVGLLVNRVFGSAVNASMSLGGSVGSHASSLSQSVVSAFSPQIMTAFGANNRQMTESLVCWASKLGILFSSFFMIPLGLELEYVLKLWLVEPPAYLAFICLAEMIMQFVDVSTQAHLVAILAGGEIRKYRLRTSAISLLTLPVVVIAILLGGGIYAIGIVLVVARVAIAVLRVSGAWRYAELNAVPWLTRVVCPLTPVVLCATLCALVPRLLMSAGIVRLLLTGITCEIVLLPMAWFLILTAEERKRVKRKIRYENDEVS